MNSFYGNTRTLAVWLKMGFALLLFAGGLAPRVCAQSRSNSHSRTASSGHTYDTTYLPVTEATLIKRINASSHDPVQLFLLIRQAHLQSFDVDAFRAFVALRKRQPKNAVVLAAYCLAYQTFGGSPQFAKDRIVIDPAGSLQDDYQKTLQQAYSLDPKLWLPYVVEGHSLIAISDQSLRSLSLLQQAVKLKPDISITHYYLADAYTVGDPRFQSFTKAGQELQKASTLKPVFSDIQYTQLELYTVCLHDHAKAVRARRDYLATLPVPVNFGPTTKQLLAMTSGR